MSSVFHQDHFNAEWSDFSCTDCFAFHTLHKRSFQWPVVAKNFRSHTNNQCDTVYPLTAVSCELTCFTSKSHRSSVGLRNGEIGGRVNTLNPRHAQQTIAEQFCCSLLWVWRSLEQWRRFVGGQGSAWSHCCLWVSINLSFLVLFSLKPLPGVLLCYVEFFCVGTFPHSLPAPPSHCFYL